MLRLTLPELLALRPCNPEERGKLFGTRKSLSAAQALAAGASIPDLLWVAGKLGRKDLCVKFALACAQRVAYLNPDPDPRVQAALDATQAWLDSPSDAARGAAWDASYAAMDAARAASSYASYAARDAARAASYAASAARAASSYAASAARAASYASYAARAASYASYAARDAEEKAQRKLFLSIFK